MIFPGTAPGPGAGAPNPATRHLRPRIGMAPDQCEAARRLKRRHPNMTPGEIAGQLAVNEGDVRLALATLRTANPGRSRGTVNVSVEAVAFIVGEARNGEPRWLTLNRLLGELLQFRGG